MAKIENRKVRIEDWQGNRYFPIGSSADSTSGTVSDSTSASTDKTDNTGWSSKEMDAGSSATIPAGFHDGTGVITAKSLASQTQATAGAADILSPKTAWINGSKITGTIPTYTTSKLRISAGYDTILPAGYYPNPIHIYSLYGDNILDLTGTSAEYEQPTESLLPNDDGYIDEAETKLVITADLIGG